MQKPLNKKLKRFVFWREFTTFGNGKIQVQAYGAASAHTHRNSARSLVRNFLPSRARKGIRDIQQPVQQHAAIFHTAYNNRSGHPRNRGGWRQSGQTAADNRKHCLFGHYICRLSVIFYVSKCFSGAYHGQGNDGRHFRGGKHCSIFHREYSCDV